MQQKPAEISQPISFRVQFMRENTKPHHFSARTQKACGTQLTKKFSQVVRTTTDCINTQFKMANLIYRIFGHGLFLVCFWSHKKNIGHGSYVARAKILIKPKIYIDDYGKEQIDTQFCDYQWIKNDKPTKKNPSGRTDKMYFLRWFFLDFNK